ncbi:transglutaminase-like domain-containing protein [Phycisphaeraceae bacterium D3-23]
MYRFLTLPLVVFGLVCSTPTDAQADAAASQNVDAAAAAADAVEAAETQLNAREILERLPRSDQRTLRSALEKAGDNQAELLSAVRDATDEHLPAVAFLLANLPDRDLQSVTAEFLLENVALAYDAWHNAPWHGQVTEEQFFQYILPFASLNERRDDWRQDFYDQLREECWKFDNVLDATNWLNDNLNDHFQVYFHARRRPKPDQSPYESIEAGYASCTGLSILMTDACRAVGIPARIVGVPLWTEIQGNHNWVEVFADRWYNVGGTNSDARDDDWVNDRCQNMTDPDHWHHSVYAACTRQTATHFPLVWDLNITYVPALNVTRFYSEPVDVEIDIPDTQNGGGTGGDIAQIFVYWAGELVARPRPRMGDRTVTIQLAGSSTYRVVIRTTDGEVHETALTTD